MKRSGESPDTRDDAVQQLEQSMLCTLLLDPAAACAAAAAEGLTAQAFSTEAHAAIYGAVMALAQGQQPVDAVTVFMLLADTGKAESCGGLPYLTGLTQCEATARNAGHYAAQLAQRYRRRQDEIALLGLAKQAADPLLPAAEYAARKAEALAGVAASADTAAGPAHFRTIDVGGLGSAKPPPPAYWWHGYLPAGLLSVLAAHGGTGKTMIALQLAVCIALGRPLFGVGVRRGIVVFYSGEDGHDLLSYRLAWICECMGVEPADLDGKLHILDATEGDPVLFREVQPDGRRVASTTPAYAALQAQLDAVQADVLMVDNMSDTYDGNEISRAPVRAYLRALGQLAKPSRAVLLLAHVDKGTARGDRVGGTEGYSGSTAVHNSARSRLFLAREKDGALVLEHQKHNLGRMRDPLRLLWRDGALPEAEAPVGPQMQFIKDLVDTKALLRLVHEFYVHGQFISTSKNSPTSLRAMLAQQPGYPAGRSSGQVLDLLRTAQRQGYIGTETYTKDSKSRERWALTGAGLELIGAAPSPTPPTPPTYESAGLGAPGAGESPTPPTPGARGVGRHGGGGVGAIGGHRGGA